ncbi:hypothetical protein [Brumimicrobium oceani]|uniref:Uncharacterized protein n=1 Tax=Brumimicrobium oceani TaxID=2100725 RepID=A0A2U2XH87_9FLAO|nr:hypothetical protein [Brumimicrobium oceani]PWH87100.1 hypothetical protein DIT68_02230 [Brumimicrobium oceani]
MRNRYVIALNRMVITNERMEKHQAQREERSISIIEISKIMDLVSKYPARKIEQDQLLTCGFSKN